MNSSASGRAWGLEYSKRVLVGLWFYFLEVLELWNKKIGLREEIIFFRMVFLLLIYISIEGIFSARLPAAREVVYLLELIEVLQSLSHVSLKSPPVGIPICRVLGSLSSWLQVDLANTDVNIVRRQIEQHFRDLWIRYFLHPLMLFRFIFLFANIRVKKKGCVGSPLIYTLQHPNRVIASLPLKL